MGRSEKYNYVFVKYLWRVDVRGNNIFPLTNLAEQHFNLIWIMRACCSTPLGLIIIRGVGRSNNIMYGFECFLSWPDKVRLWKRKKICMTTGRVFGIRPGALQKNLRKMIDTNWAPPPALDDTDDTSKRI